MKNEERFVLVPSEKPDVESYRQAVGYQCRIS